MMQRKGEKQCAMVAGMVLSITVLSHAALAQQERAPSAKPVTAPQRTETIQYDNWTITCRDEVGSSSKKKCLASFAALDQKRRVILNWVIGPDEKGNPIFIVQVPQIVSGILLENGVQVKFGSQRSRKLDFKVCASNQCQASSPMDSSLRKELLSAKNAVVTITSAAGQTVNININDIKGTDKAIAAIGR